MASFLPRNRQNTMSLRGRRRRPKQSQGGVGIASRRLSWAAPDSSVAQGELRMTGSEGLAMTKENLNAGAKDKIGHIGNGRRRECMSMFHLAADLLD